MELTLTYSARVENGVMKGFNRNQLLLDLVAFEGKKVEILIRRVKKQRSNQQNRYYFGVVVPAIQFGMRETQGFNPSREVVHEWLKSKFCIRQIGNVKTGEYDTFPMSTTELSSSQFSDYVEMCKQFAFEFLNIQIPNPNEQSMLFAQ